MTSRETGFEPTNDRAVPFAETVQGHRQSRAWERLVSYIASSDSPSDFDRAAAFAEGYAQALVDGEQIEISTERDLLIISIVDEWRRHFIRANGSTFMTSKFQRYADDEISDPSLRMPRQILATSTNQYPIDILVSRWEKHLVEPSVAHEKYPWAAEFVMGIPVPSWHRSVVWNLGQKARFIVSVWSGGDLGSYLTNEWCDSVAGRAMAESSDILIDGLQRLHSLEEYLLDRLAVPDAQGQPRVWSEVGNGERKRFLSTVFTHAHVSSDDEVLLRKTYDLYAMGVAPPFIFRACPSGDGCRKPSLVYRRVLALRASILMPSTFLPHPLRNEAQRMAWSFWKDKRPEWVQAEERAFIKAANGLKTLQTTPRGGMRIDPEELRDQILAARELYKDLVKR
eukprot:gene12886-15137_t